MKRFLGLLAVLGLVFVAGSTVSLAATQTIVQLPAPPAPAGLTSVRSVSCAPSGFNADGSIAGVCQFIYGSTGGSGRGGGYRHPKTADYAMTWDQYGQVQALGAVCSCTPPYQGTGSVVMVNGVPYYYVATDATTGNELVNSNVAGFLVLNSLPPAPAAPDVTASISGLDLQVSWTPDPAAANAITSSHVEAAPTGGSSPTLSATVSDSGTSATLSPLQANTTYLVSVVNTDAGGDSPAGTFTITTPKSTVRPSRPAISYLWWSGSDGSTLAVSWTAPSPGDSPIDSYQIRVVYVDGDNPRTGPYTQTVSGDTLSAYFPVDRTSTWRVLVRAHNAAGWSAWSPAKTLSGI